MFDCDAWLLIITSDSTPNSFKHFRNTVPVIHNTKVLNNNNNNNNYILNIMEHFKKQESLKPYFDNAYGFVVFEKLGKGAFFFVGAAAGQGDVFINNKDGTEKKVGRATVIQATGGFVFGGAIYSQIIFFETEKDFQTFTSGNFEFSGEAQVTALTASVGTRASTMGNQGITAGIRARDTTIGPHDCTYVKGMKVYTLTLGGLMYEAAISGQKFLYKADE